MTNGYTDIFEGMPELREKVMEGAAMFKLLSAVYHCLVDHGPVTVDKQGEHYVITSGVMNECSIGFTVTWKAKLPGDASEWELMRMANDKTSLLWLVMTALIDDDTAKVWSEMPFTVEGAKVRVEVRL